MLVEALLKKYILVSSEGCNEYSLLDRDIRIARRCATYNLYNSTHLKACIAEALKIGELQRSNNALDGSTSKDLVKQHTNTLEYFLKRQEGKKQKLDKMGHERASHNLYNSRHLETCIAE